MNGRRRTEVTPHRRSPGAPRVLERAAVAGFRGAAWAMRRLPEGATSAVVSHAFHASYSLWPSKRRWSNENFAHVLGHDPEHPEVRRLAVAAYRTYARYIVELMRLPGLSDEEASELVDTRTLLPLEDVWQRSNGLILTSAHIGNLEAVARGIARHGWPISGLADDTSFPELFEHLRRQREEWGVRLIPWRNLREMYSVLRRRELLALIVDWGYKPDGVPVRLFGAWTTLPAGPAALAAKTGAAIVPVAVRRETLGRFVVTYEDPIEVSSSEPGEIARATQRIADALERTIAAAPEQWYSFKPQWPATAEEKAELALRAEALLTSFG